MVTIDIKTVVGLTHCLLNFMADLKFINLLWFINLSAIAFLLVLCAFFY